MVRECEDKRFAEEYYNEMCDVVSLLSQLFYGVILIRLRLTACEIAERSNLQFNFNKQAKLARNTFTPHKYFWVRNTKLSARNPNLLH
jgi:hypothetical protein